ncbi:MAG: zinc-binding dehydrogenase [Gammaproteobacteria bacterium]
MSIRAAVFDESGRIHVVERALPEPKPGWARIAISAVGICGSDLNLLYAAGGSARGVQPGHEVAGVIDLMGEALGNAPLLSSGTPVALEPVVGCGHCRQCLTGRRNLCSQVRLCGFTRPGGMADYLVVPADTLYPVAAHLPPHLTALCEPMAVCVRGTRLGRIDLHERVAILGAGSIGLMSILTARAAGAGEVFITARHPHQQDLARTLGADAVFPDTAALLDAVGPQHVDVVVETVGGRADTIRESAQIARSGGRIVMLGVFDRDPALPGMAFFQKELSLFASNCYGRECHHPDFALATGLVAQHAGLLGHLVTHRFALDQVADAFAAAADKSTLSIKVQVHP